MPETSYVPCRADVIWRDSEPSKGREIGKYRLAFSAPTNAVMASLVGAGHARPAESRRGARLR